MHEQSEGLSEEEVEVMDILQCDTSTYSNRVQRILCDLKLKAKTLAESLIQTTQ